jgi:hypothetical protein
MESYNNPVTAKDILFNLLRFGWGLEHSKTNHTLTYLTKDDFTCCITLHSLTVDNLISVQLAYTKHCFKKKIDKKG